MLSFVSYPRTGKKLVNVMENLSVTIAESIVKLWDDLRQLRKSLTGKKSGNQLK